MNKFLDPESILAQINIITGYVAADFGCGSGYFSIPLAKLVGSEGVVHALDILPSALESVSSKAKIEGISNITTGRANLENEKGSGLQDESLDLVVLKDMLFQNRNKEIIIAEAHRVLKKGGKVLIVEWNKEDNAIGPDVEIRLKEEDARSLLEKQGFRQMDQIRAGEFHYAFCAVK